MIVLNHDEGHWHVQNASNDQNQNEQPTLADPVLDPVLVLYVKDSEGENQVFDQEISKIDFFVNLILHLLASPSLKSVLPH